MRMEFGFGLRKCSELNETFFRVFLSFHAMHVAEKSNALFHQLRLILNMNIWARLAPHQSKLELR